MGFGNGYHSRTDRGGKRYSNDMVAHAWNAQTSDAGQSGNGNFYFRGESLFSYGSHFRVGIILPDGVAVMNADSYSVSTSGHQSDARNAIKNRRHVSVPGLTDIANNFLDSFVGYARQIEKRGLTAAERAAFKQLTRDGLLKHAAALSAPILAAGEWGHDSWDYSTSPATRIPRDTSRDVALGAHLAAFAGLPAATWPKLAREAAKMAAAAEAAAKAAEIGRAERRALDLADMDSRRFREWVATLATDYNGRHRLTELRKEYKRARGLMLAAKRGKLATAGRLATVRDRIKRLDRALDTFDEMAGMRDRHKTLRMAVSRVRAWRDANPDFRRDHSTFATMRDLSDAAETLAARAPLASLRQSAAALQMAAEIGRKAVEAHDKVKRAERERERELERERERLEHAERVKLWLAGERVGRIRFDAESGGAAIRIMGDTLETSHGAEVPLAHAIKVFRFAKAIRLANYTEAGELRPETIGGAVLTTWQRNGKTVRVGLFQVDRINADGSFVAGCHEFTWPEIERAAALAGVLDCAPSSDALESSRA